MSRCENLRTVELESRLAAHAGASSATETFAPPAPDSMDEEHRPRTPERPGADDIAGIDAERRGMQILLTVRVTESCPGCLLRMSGVTRQVGDGNTHALFLVPLSARLLLVEMTDNNGQFFPVMRVELGPDGQIERQNTVSDQHADADEIIGHDESVMAMPMIGHGSDMDSNSGMSTGTSSMSHGRISDGHAPAAAAGHGMAMTSIHIGMNREPSLGSNAHSPTEPVPTHSAPVDAHTETEAGPFEGSTGAVEAAPLEEPHSPVTDIGAPSMTIEAGSVVDEESELLPQILDPLIVVAESSGSEAGIAMTESDDRAWEIGAGGTAVSFALLAASKAIESRAKRTVSLRAGLHG